MMKLGSKQEVSTKSKSRQRHAGRQDTSQSESRTTSSRVLDPPPSICLEDLRRLIPATGTSALEPPKSISIEKLQELLLPSEFPLDSPPEIDLDDLRDLLEPAGVVTRREVEFKTRDLLAPGEGQSTSKFRAWQNVIVPAPALKALPLVPAVTSKSTQSLDLPETDTAKQAKTAKRAKDPKTRSLDDLGSRTAEIGAKVKVKLVEKREDADVKLDGPEAFVKKLEQLAEGDNLEKWIAGLDLPKEFDLPKIRLQIQTFLKDKCWEKHGSIKFDIMDGTLTKKIWAWFKDLSIAKQILVVIGLSIVAAAVGFLTMQLLALIWPGVLGVATSGEAALGEIGIEAFKIRQEPAFHLLHLHAEQAKPLSYAWANQYILWKYCRNI